MRLKPLYLLLRVFVSFVSAVRRVVWSRRQPFASVGAVLSFLDGPTGCDFAFCVVWFRFRFLRRYLALWPAEVGRVYRLLAMVHEGCPAHGPIHLLSASAAEIGFQWDPHALGLGLVCPCLAIWLALFSISMLLFSMLGVTRLLLIFVGGKVFGVGLFWTSMVLCSSLILLMLEKEIRHCFVPLWRVVSGMVSFFVMFVVSLSHAGSVVLQMVMVIFLGAYLSASC